MWLPIVHPLVLKQHICTKQGRWFISISRISSLKDTLRLIMKIKKAPWGWKKNNRRTPRAQRKPVATCQIRCQLISPSLFLEALTINCKSLPWYSIVAPMRYAGGQWRTDEEGSRWKGLVGMAITGCGSAASLQGPIPVRIYWSFFSILVFLLISHESTGGSKILYIVLALFLYALYKLRGQVGEEVWLNRTPPWLNGNPKPFFSVQLLQINPLARRDPLEPQWYG